MKNFVLAATFTYSYEYAVLRNILDEEGISYFFENETMIGLLPFYSEAIGGIHLKVHKNDLKRVLEIIDDLSTNSHLRIV